MSASISVASAIEAHRISSDVPFLCLLDIEIVSRRTGMVTTTLRVVRNSEPVTFRGNVYEAGLFDISVKKAAGTAAEVTLTVTDYTQAVAAYMEANQGIVGSKVTFYVINATALPDGQPEAAEYFEIVGANSQAYRHSFTLGAENSLTQSFPGRRQTKDFCQWRYKGAECKYAGDRPTCDLSLQGPNGCAAHENTINFGAFPGINSNGFRYV